MRANVAWASLGLAAYAASMLCLVDRDGLGADQRGQTEKSPRLAPRSSTQRVRGITHRVCRYTFRQHVSRASAA